MSAGNKQSTVVLANHESGVWVLYVNREAIFISVNDSDYAYCHLHQAATAIAEKLECSVRVVHVPSLPESEVSGDDYLETLMLTLDKMGAFNPQGCIFSAINGADIKDVNGIECRDGFADNWRAELKRDPKSAIWFPDTLSSDFEGYAISFYELCLAEPTKDGQWKVPFCMEDREKAKTLLVRFFNLMPYED